MKTIDSDKQAEIAKLYRTGLNIIAISDLISVSVSTTHKYIHKYISPSELRGYNINLLRDREILSLYDSGFTMDEIGKEFDISRQRVSQIIHRNRK